MVVPGSRGGENTDRILRMLARFLGVGYVAYFVILIPTIDSFAPHMAAWWTPVTVALVFGTGLLPGIVSLRGSAVAVRRSAAVAALTYLGAIASWWLVWDGVAVAGDAEVYLTVFPGLAGVTAAVAWRPPVAFAYLAVAVFGEEAMSVVVGDEFPDSSLLPAFAFSFTFTALFVGGAGMALRTGQVLDATRDATVAEASVAAARRARAAERERFDALIHDSVISTFLVATAGRNPDAAANEARAALAALDGLRGTRRSGEHLPMDHAVEHLRTATADADPHATFTVAVIEDGDVTPDVPADVLHSLRGALTEALRNSLRHAGPEARRAVTVTVGSRGLGVSVHDDGRGFIHSQVAPHRLGIAVSIVGRMDSLPGGSAVVDSAPGEGTAVRLRWTRP